MAAPVTTRSIRAHLSELRGGPFGRLSILRGKLTKTAGTIVLDKEGKTGTVDITVDAASLDFGNAKLNEKAKSEKMFDVAKFPTITITELSPIQWRFPTEVDGQLTLHA